MTLFERVRKTISQHHLIQRDEIIVLGVSGGPDSLALARLFRNLRDEWHLQIHLAHLNHQLRGTDSEADAEFIVWLAREWNLAATIESRDVAAYAREKKLSVEEAAREMRYEFLVEVAQQVGARTIAVAHHADDQVETVLMHLLRGAGMAGLRGMQYKFQFPNTNYKVQIIRPLLDATRAEIESYCEENALHPRRDLSNLDTTLFRNRLRHEVLPYLETINPNLRAVLLHTSRALADDYDFLQTGVTAAFNRVARQDNGAIIFDRAAWSALHPSLQRGTLRVAVEGLQQSLHDIAWTHIETARMIALEKTAGAKATLPRGLRLTVGYAEFFVTDETHELPIELPQLHVECLTLPNQGTMELPGSEWVVEMHRGASEQGSEAADVCWSVTFDAEKIHGEMVLRRRKPGDRFQPVGMNGHTKSLHRLMIDEKILGAARERLPILCDDEKILWVCGYHADERAQLTEATREVVQVTLRKKETFS